jgi:hypothetical protein
MITIQAPTLTLDEALQSFIRISLHPNEGNMVLFVPTFEMQNTSRKRLREFLGMLPGWLCVPVIRDQQGIMEFTNGNSIRILNSTMRARGLTINRLAMYMHQDYPWTQDDMYSVLPAVKGPLDQHFYYVTE